MHDRIWPLEPIEGLRIRLRYLSSKDARVIADIITPDGPFFMALIDRHLRHDEALHKE